MTGAYHDLIVSLTKAEAVIDRRINKQNSHPLSLQAAPATLPRALPASRQGCPSHLSLTARRHLPWAHHVNNPTMIWATTSALPAMTGPLQCSGSCQVLVWNPTLGQPGRTSAELPLLRAVGTFQLPVTPRWSIGRGYLICPVAR